MLPTSTLSPLCNSTSLLNATQNNNSQAFTTKVPSCLLSGLTLTDSSFMLCFKSLQFQHSCVNFNAIYGNGFSACASKKRGQAGGVGVVEADDFEQDDGDIFGEFDDDEEEDEDEVVVIPVEERKKWLKNKPLGFGVGKVYDTSVEDRLLEEMRKSKEAQAANLTKLKNNPIMPGVKKDEEKKVQEVKSGVKVRLVNLPKKKNIHRDLKVAFQGIPGIIDIVPAVSGNKKTRDPVCKGIAFVYFNRKEDAARFVQLYSGETVTFGRIQKKIKCVLLNENSPVSSLEASQNATTAAATPELIVPAMVENPNEDSDIDDSAFSSWDETGSSSDESDPIHRAEWVEENEDYAATLNVDDDDDDSVEVQTDSGINSLSLEQKSPTKPKQGNVSKKKPPSKEKGPKPKGLGAANRLKGKEKAVLSNVFSKYGSQNAPASKDS